MKKIILPIVIVASLFLASCNENKKIDEQSNNKINIVTSISPIASVVKYI
jgi:ABC-type Zn uptake system ZnuABC Zn-binding protein ZnuA